MTVDVEKDIENDNGNNSSNNPDDNNDVTVLSDRAIKWRARYKGKTEEFENFKINIEKEKQELQEKQSAALREKELAHQKWVDAEIKAQAVAAGIKDIDFVKLIDKSSVKIDEKGDLIGINEVINDFKTRKPDLFGFEKKINSSTNSKVPDTKVTKSDARTMSKDDWNKQKNKYMNGRF